MNAGQEKRQQEKIDRERIEKERIYDMFRPYPIGSLHMITIKRGLKGPGKIERLVRYEGTTPEHDVILYVGEPASQEPLDIKEIGYSSIKSSRLLQ